MPSRLVVCAIVLFWAATTGWLLYREVWPYLGAGEPPPYTVDITEQVAASPASWYVYERGRRIGLGISQVERRNEDRTFDLQTQFRFETDGLTFFKRFEVTKITSMYRVTEEGELKALASSIKLRERSTKPPVMPEMEFSFEGEVQDDALQPKLLFNGQPQTLFELKPIPVARHGNVLNPMHLLNRLPGLRTAQRWRIPMLDPFSGQGDAVIGGLANQGLTIPVLEATVVDGTLEWGGQEVPCRVVEYHEPGKEVTARTWTRRRDGLVLQQEARHAGYEFVLTRVPER
jgi:hypothetical protein